MTEAREFPRREFLFRVSGPPQAPVPVGQALRSINVPIYEPVSVGELLAEMDDNAAFRYARADLASRYAWDFDTWIVLAYDLVYPNDPSEEEVGFVWRHLGEMFEARDAEFGLRFIGSGDNTDELARLRHDDSLQRDYANLQAQMATEGVNRLNQQQLYEVFGMEYHPDGLLEFIRRRVERSRDQAEADKKAEALLLRHLNKEQAADYRDRDRFGVLGQISGALYWIKKARSINVDVTFPDPPARKRWFSRRPLLGQPNPPEARPGSHRLCLTLPDAPLADQLLMQKLMIEGDERGFLRKATWWGGGTGDPVHVPAWYQQMMGAIDGQIDRATGIDVLRRAQAEAWPATEAAVQRTASDGRRAALSGALGNVLGALGLV